MTNFATTSFMPLLARFVIAAAMLTSGWVNCFGQIEIRPAVAEGLRSMEIQVHTHDPETVPESQAVDVEAESKEKPTITQSEIVTSRGVHRIVWLIHEKWPDLGGWGTFIAWVAAVSQLVAGILLLIGLFTRFAALAICIATGTAIYLVSGDIHGMFGMNPFAWPHDSHRFIQLFAGLGLFTLSLGLLFSGAGSFSIDHLHTKPPQPQFAEKSNSKKNSNK